MYHYSCRIIQCHKSFPYRIPIRIDIAEDEKRARNLKFGKTNLDGGEVSISTRINAFGTEKLRNSKDCDRELKYYIAINSTGLFLIYINSYLSGKKWLTPDFFLRWGHPQTDRKSKKLNFVKQWTCNILENEAFIPRCGRVFEKCYFDFQTIYKILCVMMEKQLKGAKECLSSLLDVLVYQILFLRNFKELYASKKKGNVIR